MQTETKIQEAIRLLTKNRTTLVIAHRLSTIMNSKRFMLLTMVLLWMKDLTQV